MRVWQKTDAATLHAGLFTALAAACVYVVSPNVDILGSDDGTYADFWPGRSSFYPLFVAAFGKHPVAAVTAQCALYLASWYWFIHVLHRRFRSHLITCSFGAAVVGNYAMHWLHLVIAAESLTMTCGNVLVIALLNMTDKSRHLLPWVAVAGAAVGAMVGLRTAMWSFVPVILPVAAAFALWRGQSAWRALVYVGASIGFLVALEAAGFYAVHDKRDSLAPRHIYAKAAMLSLQPGFAVPSLPLPERDIYEKTIALMRPYKNYLTDDAESMLMKIAIRGSFEGFAQAHALPWLARGGLGAEPDDAAKSRIGYAAIAANPIPYAILTARHYIDFWGVGGDYKFAVAALDAKPPVFSPAVLNNAAPPAAKTNTKRYGDFSLALITFPAFALLGAVCLVLSLWLGVVWSRVIFGRQTVAALPSAAMLVTALLSIAQANLVFVSMLTASGDRYFMPVFPFFALACLAWFQSLAVARRRRPARA